MKLLMMVLSLVFLTHHEVMAQTDFVLDPSQSMLLNGKGPGQDATINPYEGQDCYAIVKHIGKRQFSIRVQQKERIIEETIIIKGEIKKILLLKGYQLYLDGNAERKAKARVDYEKISE